LNGEADRLKMKLDHILAQVREVVDLSLEIKAKNPREGVQVTALWEDFLRQFFLYVKKRGRETNQNLMTGVSLTRITKS